MKVLFAITTGRESFSSTLKMIADNLEYFSHTRTHQVDVAVNYDTNYRQVSATTFTQATLPTTFSNVSYIGLRELDTYRELLANLGLSENHIRILLPPSGYGNKKNSILIKSLMDQYDLVIFWDDDEYPIAALEAEHGVKWIMTDVLKSHLCLEHARADVTCGFITGYDSPIPMNINQILSHNTASFLGNALVIGTEFIQPDSFTNPENAIFIPPMIPEINPIHSTRGGKWVTGGNMAIRSRSLKRGVIPPFYVPDDSRGDDTIISMGLEDAHVYQVPSGIFHDCFQRHMEILEGQYPDDINTSDFGTEQQTKRFAQALKGWLAYSPLMIRLREGENSMAQTQEMIQLLKQVDDNLYNEYPELGRALNYHSLASLLEHYFKMVPRQYEELQQAKEAWNMICSRV